MKKLLILCAVFLYGCGMQQQEEARIVIPPRTPFHILLSDTTNHVVGMAIPIQDKIFVTADHLLQTYENIFWKGEEIQVLARDFDNDLLFFTLDRWVGNEAIWSDSPPVVGSAIFWVDGAEIAEEQVHSIAELGEDQIKRDVLVLSGTSDVPNSGSPVFDATGKIFGVLVGGDMSRKVSFAVRADVVRRILKESME
ncbi:serine protease [Candidatus Gracilibacteria bacterium]|nr:serine protease [Candidatus Gracilibacteria bacterium]